MREVPDSDLGPLIEAALARGVGFRRWAWAPADDGPPPSDSARRALAWCRRQVLGARRVKYVSLVLRREGGAEQSTSYESLGVFRVSDLRVRGSAAKTLERALMAPPTAGKAAALFLFDWDELLGAIGEG